MLRLGGTAGQWLVDDGVPAYAQIDAVADQTEVYAPVPRPKPPKPPKAAPSKDTGDPTAPGSEFEPRPGDSQAVAQWRQRMQQVETDLKAQIEALLERAKATGAAEADEPEVVSPQRSDAARTGSRLSPGRASALSHDSATPTLIGGAAATTNASPATKTASPPAGATSHRVHA